MREAELVSDGGAEAANAFGRSFAFFLRLAQQPSTFLPENSLFVIDFSDAPSIDRFVQRGTG
jgi:hypothetical protein